MSNKKILNFVFLLSISLVFSQEHLFKAATIPEELKQNANAVVRLNDILVTIDARDELHTSERRIVTVFNEKGYRAVQAGAGYNNYNKVKKIEAHIFNEFGNEIKKFKKHDFTDQSAVDGGSLYSDSRILYMGYTPVSYPFTVEFTCEMETSNTLVIPSWRPIPGYYVSVENDNYTLKDHAGLGLRFKEKHLKDYKVEKQITTNDLKYSLKQVKAVKPEDLSPGFSDFNPKVMFAVNKFHYYGVDGEASNWLEFGDWMNNELLKGRDQVSTKTQEAILKLTEGIDDPVEKAKKVFEYVQNNTRYISVQVGIGGVQPISAMEVDEVKYGDCKGLTNYTQSLLKVAGVTSYYTVVESGRHIENLESDFASIAQGDHIILAIPTKDEMLWVDCTSQIHPFNFIGDFTDNRNVLVIKPGASEIMKTVEYPDTLNFQGTTAEIRLKSDGSMFSKVKRLTKGTQYDNRFPLERRSKKDIEEFYKETWGYVNNLEIQDYDFNNDKENIVFTENLNLEARNYASFNGDLVLFPLNALNKNTFVPDRYRSRKLPLEIQRGYLDEDHFVFKLPEDFEVASIPENMTIDNKFGTYKIEIKQEDNTIHYNRKLLIKKGTFPNTDYRDYRNFRKQIASNDRAKAVLKKISNK
ncbi:DUF3857 domain-containing protein [Gaetbulibacter aestuarii]|uniref:DUF3857 domain-containing protein n=1 Tax=Gaetbulibacter aestuarii TaxID=1502358 RepID=A0ABW7N0F5_9FLAO